MLAPPNPEATIPFVLFCFKYQEVVLAPLTDIDIGVAQYALLYPKLTLTSSSSPFGLGSVLPLGLITLAV